MDTTALQMGGIVGLAQNSTVQYCANTGDMTSWTPHTGGIVGELYQDSKIINCYYTGKMVPLGNGTTDFGGIAGTVWAGTEIRHCYFAGEMDLSQYTATTPYKRLGGIAGGVSSDTPVFKNNYFVEAGNVTACSKYTEAGTAANSRLGMRTAAGKTTRCPRKWGSAWPQCVQAAVRPAFSVPSVPLLYPKVFDKSRSGLYNSSKTRFIFP